jgi:hypothetical protein
VAVGVDIVHVWGTIEALDQQRGQFTNDDDDDELHAKGLALFRDAPPNTTAN